MLTADQLHAFKRIHEIVHKAFIYVPDIEKWKTQEYWVSGKDILSMGLTGHYEGDCDDFALIMRHECRQADIPSRLVFCWVRPTSNQEGGYHLVLEVGGHVADCRFPHLMEKDQLNYEWIGISGYERGEPWQYLPGFENHQPWPHLRGK